MRRQGEGFRGATRFDSRKSGLGSFEDCLAASEFSALRLAALKTEESSVSNEKEALAYNVKVPLVYTNVQLRNWKVFEKLNVHSVHCPGSFFTAVEMDFPVSMGGINLRRSQTTRA
jgi:hypothetical protein